MRQTKIEEAAATPPQDIQPRNPGKAVDRMHLIEQLPTKELRIKALILEGISWREIVSRFDIRSSTVKKYLKELLQESEIVRINNYLSALMDDNAKNTYKTDMEKAEEIVDLLSSWDSKAVSRLVEDLRSGKLAQQYAAAAEPGPAGSTVDRSSPPDGQLYAARSNRKESAPQFIERVYGGSGWLTGEFTRADLRKLDCSALVGLENWERKHGRAMLNLPTVKERNDKLLERDPATLTKAERQEQGRVRLSRQHHGIS